MEEEEPGEPTCEAEEVGGARIWKESDTAGCNPLARGVGTSRKESPSRPLDETFWKALFDEKACSVSRAVRPSRALRLPLPICGWPLWNAPTGSRAVCMLMIASASTTSTEARLARRFAAPVLLRRPAF